MKLDEFINVVKRTPDKLFQDYEIKTYIPLLRKLAICDIAVIGADDTPPALIVRDETGYATVDSASRILYMTNIYLAEYFGVELDVFGSAEYDILFAEDILPKIGRLADRGSSSKHKKTVCQIQDDFRSLEKLLNKEVASELGRLNDPYKRILQRINDDLTPKNLQQGIEELKKVTDEIEQRQGLKVLE